MKLTHQRLCKLAEIELSLEEDITQRFKAWREEERQECIEHLNRVQEAYIQRIEQKKKEVKRFVGFEPPVRARRVISLPV